MLPLVGLESQTRDRSTKNACDCAGHSAVITAHERGAGGAGRGGLLWAGGGGLQDGGGLQEGGELQDGGHREALGYCLEMR